MPLDKKAEYNWSERKDSKKKRVAGGLGAAMLITAGAVYGWNQLKDALAETAPEGPRPAVCTTEVAESALLWNISRNLDHTGRRTSQVTYELGRDNPDLPNDNYVSAGTILNISDRDICVANDLPLETTE